MKMAQPTKTVPRNLSVGVTANHRPDQFRVSAAPSVSVTRCLGKASERRKQKSTQPERFLATLCKQKELLVRQAAAAAMACQNRVPRRPRVPLYRQTRDSRVRPDG